MNDCIGMCRKGVAMQTTDLYGEIMKRTTQGQCLLMVTKMMKQKGSLQKDMQRSLIAGESVPYDEILANGSPIKITEEKAAVFMEPFYPKERLLILGGGHIAVPLVKIGNMIGMSVTVIDDRPSFANRDRFSEADCVICEDFNRFLKEATITGNDYIVIITRGHRHDKDCLKQLLQKKESIYIGMIGSRRRVKALKELLIEEGEDATRLERVCTPIGLSIGAVTPEEISVSIAAEIIQRKRKDAKDGFLISRSDLDTRVLEKLSNTSPEPRAVVTILSTKGSVPRGAGAKMLVYQTGRIEGSIGGGCSEGAVMRDALMIIGTGNYEIKTIDMTGEVAESDGMVCGGMMEILIEDDSGA